MWSLQNDSESHRIRIQQKRIQPEIQIVFQKRTEDELTTKVTGKFTGQCIREFWAVIGAEGEREEEEKYGDGVLKMKNVSQYDGNVRSFLGPNSPPKEDSTIWIQKPEFWLKKGRPNPGRIRVQEKNYSASGYGFRILIYAMKIRIQDD